MRPIRAQGVVSRPRATAEQRLDLTGRLALSIPEAAQALGVSERLLRTVLREIPHLHIGRRTVIPVGPLEEWLRERAKAEPVRVEKAVDEILETVRTSEV